MQHTKAPAPQADVFQTLPIPQALRKMILPAVASQLIVLIYNMADTFFVGKTNNPYMVAGTSLILPVFNITLCLAGLAGIGGGSLISRLLGQDRKEEARRVSAFSLYLSLIIAALFSGRGAVAGVQYPHAVPTQLLLRYVRHRLVPGNGGYSNGDPVAAGIPEMPAQ